MQWIEIIHVRAYSKASRDQELKEARELSVTPAPKPLEDITFWVRSDLETDVSILLIWTDGAEHKTYSPVGLQIADSFSQFGWVNHSVWMDTSSTAKHGAGYRAH